MSTLIRLLLIAAVPLAGEFAKSEEAARVLALFVARQHDGRPFLAPPDTPPAIVAVYRSAFAKVVEDEDFRQPQADHRRGDHALAQRSELMS